MIVYKTGDIVKNVTSGIILHGCNAQGVMGAGLAKQIKQTYPDVYKAYKELNNYHVGDVIMVRLTEDFYIGNAIIQEYYGNDKNYRYVSYDAIDFIFVKMTEWCLDNNITELNIPRIGAGLANGSWKVISSIIEDIVEDKLTVNVWTLYD